MSFLAERRAGSFLACIDTGAGRVELRIGGPVGTVAVDRRRRSSWASIWQALIRRASLVFFRNPSCRGTRSGCGGAAPLGGSPGHRFAISERKRLFLT